MARVFLSYDREDDDKARSLAGAIEQAGHSVWWDLHIRSGAQYSKVIDEALKAADAVVVLWSKQSVESAWVRDEAAAGRDTGRLIPVRLDSTEPPLGFRQFQTIDLSRWKGRGKPAQLPTLLADIGALATGSSVAPRAAPAPTERPSRRPARRLVAVALLIAGLLVAGLIAWRVIERPSSTPLVAVAASEPSPASNALARDLLVQLGRLQATNPDALKLVASTGGKSDLVLEVGGTAQDELPKASLALLYARNRQLLWSRNYEQPSGRHSDLRQQLAYSAAQVLRCAGQATSTEGGTLSSEMRALYLNGCAEVAAGVEGDQTAVIALFERVTRAAPGFRPAWEQLLLASSGAAARFDPFSTEGSDHQKALRRRMAAAAQRFPDLPELLIARLVLTPPAAYGQRLELIDRAKQLAEDNVAVLVTRALELARVGRFDEALSDTERALKLDPLSPTVSNSLISLLAYSGRLDRAEEALKEAERSWPGSSDVLDAQFRFHLRYGDPRKALAILRTQGSSQAHQAFLEARIDPAAENIDKAVGLSRIAAERFDDFSWLAAALAEFGREQELHSLLAQWKESFADGGFDVLFRPQFKTFRQDPRFLGLAHRAGLLGYWRSSGKWPDFCFEPDLPYDCKAEAAKLAA